MIWKVTSGQKNCLARLGTINCNCDMQWFMPCTTCNVQAPRTVLKESLERDSESLSDVKKKTISFLVRNSSNRSRENAKFRIPKVTIITPNCQLFAGDIHPSWVTYLLGTFWESPWITLCLQQLQVPKCAIDMETLQRILLRSIQHFSRGSQLPPSTPWWIFL